MDFPADFSPDAKARIIAEKIEADRGYTAIRSGWATLSTDQGRAGFIHANVIWIARVFGAYAIEACDLAKRDVWQVDRVIEAVSSWLNDLLKTIRERCEQVRINAPDLTSIWAESVFHEVKAQIETTHEWMQHHVQLLSIAKRQSVPVEPKPTPTERVKPVRRFMEPNPDLLKNKDTVNRTEAATALGISPRTFDRWVKDRDKKLLPLGLGARKRFKSTAILRVLRQQNLRQDGQK